MVVSIKFVFIEFDIIFNLESLAQALKEFDILQLLIGVKEYNPDEDNKSYPNRNAG